MELQLKIIGALLILLGLTHALFPKRFQWKQEFAIVSLLNRQMMYVHTFFVALTVFLMGVLSIAESHELIHTALGRKVSLGFGIFWAARLLVQIFGYSKALWKGKILETAIHILFSVFWIYFSAVFLLIYFG